MISETIQLGCTKNKGKVEKVCKNGNDNKGEGAIGNIDELHEVDVDKKAKVQKEMTMQDIYSNRDELDDYDDTEWEPSQEQLSVKKWFCDNCTMVNFDGVIHCDICGEHKDSRVLKHGCFTSPFSQEATIIEGTAEAVSSKESVSQSPALANRTAVGFDERMLLHREVQVKSHPHPERPDRLRAIVAGLTNAGIFPRKCRPIAAREITHGELLKVHSLTHVQAVELTDQAVSSYFTPDTYANQHSARAARLAAGLCADLASEIYCGHAKNGFALIRPPGHHAGVHKAMGFCLHNNAAIAALAAQAAGAKKVLIVDWDVHHGNGTQEIFDGSTSVLYISLHRFEGGRFYPGTGASDEVGTKGAEGYCVNIPWSVGGVGDSDYIFAFQYAVLPIALEFDPDFTIVSAGFDAARGDPLGCCDVTPSGYARMTHMLSTLACGKMLVILEGGYNLRSISSSTTAVIKVLLGESTECLVDSVEPSRAAMQTVLEVLKIQSKYWKSLTANLTKLQLIWESYLLQHPRKSEKKRRRRMLPVWLMCGRKRLLYHVLFRRHRLHPRPRGW